MEANPYIPNILWTGAAFLLWLGIRGWKRKSVLGWAGNPRTTQELGYYPIMAGYLLGGTLLLILALAETHRRVGWLYTILLAIIPLVTLYFVSRIKFGPISILKPLSRLKRKKASKEDPITDITPQSRALATSAMQAQVKGLDLHTLGGTLPNPRAEKKAQKRLKKEWQISSTTFEEHSSFRTFKSDEYWAIILGPNWSHSKDIVSSAK